MFQAVNIIDYDQEAIFIVVDYFNGRLKCLLDVMKLLIQMQGLNQRKGEIVFNAVDPENMSDAGIGSRSVKNFLQDRFGKRIFPVVDQKAPAVSEKKGSAAPHPRRKPIKKTRKVEEAVDKPEDPVNDSDSDAGADTQLEAENSVGEAEDTTEENFPADDADALPWSEDTGQEKKNVQKDEPTDKTEQESSAAAKTPSAVTITKDDITAVIVAKIKKKRDNNEKIGRLLKTYGVAQLSDLPAEKYEAFLADVSQI